jgi:hypothetical protein
LGCNHPVFFKLLKCKHQCHCACSLEIGTCIINDAGRQLQTKNNENACFILMYMLNNYTWSRGTPKAGDRMRNIILSRLFLLQNIPRKSTITIWMDKTELVKHKREKFN